MRLLNVGYGNVVAISRVIAVVGPNAAPIRRLREEARERGKLVDATQGRKTRSVIITDSDHVILSAVQAETIAQRLEELHVEAIVKAHARGIDAGLDDYAVQLHERRDVDQVRRSHRSWYADPGIHFGDDGRCLR